MTLVSELKKLDALIGKDDKAFNKQLETIKKSIKTADDKKIINSYLKKMVADTLAESKAQREEISMRLQLEKVSEIISLSYIAKNYFNKTRGWLHHRINNSIVNGKPAKFTHEEVKTLNRALKDVGKIIGSTRVSL